MAYGTSQGANAQINPQMAQGPFSAPPTMPEVGNALSVALGLTAPPGVLEAVLMRGAGPAASGLLGEAAQFPVSQDDALDIFQGVNTIEQVSQKRGVSPEAIVQRYPHLGPRQGTNEQRPPAQQRPPTQPTPQQDQGQAPSFWGLNPFSTIEQEALRQ